MALSDLSPSAQNYLKIMWSLGEWSDEPVTASLLASRTGFRISSVSGAVSKLAEQGLVNHAPYGAISLTDAGRAHALQMIRRHRLIETFLVEVLGYRWDEVHDEAEDLEHAVSDLLISRIDDHLGHPTRDPHGDPIPGPDGSMEKSEATSLEAAPEGATVIIERISDDDPELLRFLSSQGVDVGTRLTVGASSPYSGSLLLCLGDKELPLAPTAAAEIWVREA
ncbi:MAG: metal-dependent transcriptional regulator [Flaviflexus sp.]|nr:metal-dependent transcriptional regulator [Flaviflexus sp.]